MARAGSSPISDPPRRSGAGSPGPGRLFVVATPLGNLEDITFRAVETLRGCPVIACEDTRHSRRLLDRYGIRGRLISCHEHNEEAAAAQIVALIESGLDVALISDAGTPGISDPGFRAVRLAAERGFEVTPVPGPSALVSSVSVSGLPTDRFLFGGFLPQKKFALESALNELSGLRATLVFYCPARRLGAALAASRKVLGDRRAVICRELTKVHEQVARGRLSELIRRMDSGEIPLRGEVVLLLGGKEEGETVGPEELVAAVDTFLDSLEDAPGLGAKALTVMTSDRLKTPRNRVYPLVCAWLNRRS